MSKIARAAAAFAEVTGLTLWAAVTGVVLLPLTLLLLAFEDPEEDGEGVGGTGGRAVQPTLISSSPETFALLRDEVIGFQKGYCE